MDPLSFGASIIAFIEIADRVIRTCKHCIDTIKDAPKDMQMILGETTSLRAIIDSLSVVELHKNTVELVPSLFESTGPVEACRRCLIALERLLPAEPQDPSTTKRRKLTFAELAWPLKESKARKLLAEISHQKATLLLAITCDLIHDVKDIKVGVKRLESAITASQRQEIIRWLESTNPSALHNLAFKKHEKPTSQWLLQSSEWLAWLTRADSLRFLWIHGIPGSGKTVLASFIIEQLKQFCEDNDGLAHGYYYCHYTHDQDEASPFLRWILGKLSRQAQWIPQKMKSLHDQGCDPSIPELENALESLAARFDAVYIVIDAVDESSPRADLVAVLATLAVDKRFHNVQILATSRLYFDIERVFTGISTSISMSNPLLKKDIRSFIHCRLISSHRMKRWAYMFPSIENALAAGANGMFRWADCQIQAIERLQTEAQIQLALRNLPQDLAETYVRIFQNIPEITRPVVRQILVWVRGHARSPWVINRGINAELLISAASYDLYGVVGARGVDCDYLKELAGCLLTFSPCKNNGSIPPSPSDSEDEAFDYDGKHVMHVEHPRRTTELFVTFAHYTVVEFLDSEIILQSPVSYFAMSNDDTNSEFMISILRQALSVDPAGTSTDWVNDREAYCLTLVPAMYLDAFSKRPDIQDLFIQYFNPRSPHFARIEPIQTEIALGLTDEANVAKCFFIQGVPVLVCDEAEMSQALIHAATLLNILLVVGTPVAKRYIIGKDIKEMLNQKMTVTWVDDGTTAQGTALEVLRIKPNPLIFSQVGPSFFEDKDSPEIIIQKT